MEMLLASPMGILSLIILCSAYLITAVFLVVVVYEYRHLILSRGQLFAVMQTGDVLQTTRSHFTLLFTYVVTIFTVSVVVSIFFLLRFSQLS